MLLDVFQITDNGFKTLSKTYLKTYFLGGC